MQLDTISIKQTSKTEILNVYAIANKFSDLSNDI